MPAQSPTLSPTLSAIDGGVAGIVLGDARLDLADQVGADVGGLGEDAAAEPREDRDQRRAERQRGQRLDDRRGRWARAPTVPVRYQKKTAIESSPSPATSMPVTAPERNAMVARPAARCARPPRCGRWRLTEMFMPT